MWLVLALLSAIFAALTSILAKVGIDGVNSNLATAIRTVVVVIDPPRKGMSEAAVAAVAAIAPERIVYVSCDPGTLARDVLRFSSLGYALQKATAVDMFPRTRHVEAVALMVKYTPPVDTL